MNNKDGKNEVMIWRSFIIYIILFQILFLFTHNRIFITITLFFSIIGIVFKNVPKYLFKFGNLIGEFYTKLILSLIFCFLVCPISFVKKLIIRKEKNNPESFWEEIDFKIEKENFEKMG